MSNQILIDALKKVQRALEQEKEYVRNEPCPVWLERDSDWRDRKREADEAYHVLTSQIIELEIQQEDPIQRSERYMEISMACAMNGNRDDPSLYMHTAEQERQFQMQIQHDIEYGYYDSDGYWEDGIYADAPQKGACKTCGVELWDDEGFWVEGSYVCDGCIPYIDAWRNFVMLFNNGKYELRGNSYDGEWSIELNEYEQDLRDYPYVIRHTDDPNKFWNVGEGWVTDYADADIFNLPHAKRQALGKNAVIVDRKDLEV